MGMKESALALAKRGFKVFPLHNILRNGECSCGSRGCTRAGKHPRWDAQLLPNGVKGASSNPKAIERWWTRWPDANIGGATGHTSGVVAIDVESKEGLNQVKKKVGAIQCGLVSRTGGGGWHLFFKHPGGYITGTVRVLPDVDIRGDGEYVVLPPSNHKSGNTYRWERTNSLDQLPDGLIPKKSSGEDAPIDWEENFHEGKRDVEATRRAGKLIAAGIPPEEVIPMLQAWNEKHCSPPLDPADIRKIAYSIGRRDKEHGIERSKDAEKEPTPFTVIGMAEAAIQFGGEELGWTIDSWLPEATVGLVVAPPGSYKTYILLNAAYSVASGEKFLGEYEVNDPGPVLFIQQEDPFPMLLDRMGQMLGLSDASITKDGTISVGRAPDLPIYWHLDQALDFRNPRIVHGMLQAVRELKPKLVILDPLYSAVDMKDYMAESAQQMLIMKRMRDEIGCSFMIAHHTKRSNAEGGRVRDELWGSQFLNAWLETGWQIRKGSGDNSVKVIRHFKKVQGDSKAIEIEFDISQWSFKTSITEGPEDPEDAIRNLIMKGNVSNQRQIADTLGMKGLGTVTRILKDLGVEKVDGVYVIPRKKAGGDDD